jgi:hypothetical protein
VAEFKYATEPSTQKTWRDSLLFDMLLSAVSVLVVAQPSSEVPKGLVNYPVHSYRASFNCIRYSSFSGDKNINCGVNESFHFVKQYFILKVYQPITLSNEFQNNRVISLL